VLKTGRDSRFVADGVLDVSQTSADVGPGTYDAEKVGAMVTDLTKAVERSSAIQASKTPGGLGFTSRASQHQLPHEAPLVKKEQSQKPGPGTYENAAKPRDMVARAKASFNSLAVLSGKFGFGSQSARYNRDLLNQTSDPGSYNPNPDTKSVHDRSLASQANNSHNVRAGGGRLGFGWGAQSARTMPQDIHGGEAPTALGLADPKKPFITPGPGAYTPQLDETGREYDLSVMAGAETMPNATFVSKTDRLMANTLPNKDNPGPGAYDPLFTLVEERWPDGGVLKTGRDSRFVADGVLDVSQTSADVGPGTYSPRNLPNGGKTSIALSVEEKSDPGGMSWQFVSGSVRNIFSGLFKGEDGEPLQSDHIKV
jgi:hypothetical protein